MTDEELVGKIIKIVKMSKWRDIAAMGINAQQAQKIKRGLPVVFMKRTLDRMREKLESGRNQKSA